MSVSSEQKLKILLRDRQIAYRHVFAPDETNPAKSLVMADLDKFCRANETTFHSDARLHAALEGRREVVLRIRDYLVLGLDELYNKYGG